MRTFKAQSHPFIICACGFVCAADNVKLITVMSDSFYSHQAHSGAGMLNKTPSAVLAVKQYYSYHAKMSVVYLQNMRKSRPILTDVYNIYLQYQTCIDMDTIMTHWDIPPIVESCLHSFYPPTHPPTPENMFNLGKSFTAQGNNFGNSVMSPFCSLLGICLIVVNIEVKTQLSEVSTF